MSKNIHTLFQLAAKFFYKKYRGEGGVLDTLAEEIGITPTYLSAVINGSRVCSLDLQNRIAKTFYGPYDQFVAVGRRIADGKDPLENDPYGQKDSVEKIIAQLTHLVMDHKRMAEKLKASEIKFRDISLTSGDVIFELDENFKVTFVSGRVMQIVGFSEHDLLGKSIFKFFSEDEWKNIVPIIDTAIKTRTIVDTVLTVQKNGKTFYRHCIAKPVFDARNNSFLGFRGTYRDITRRKHLEHNLQDEVSLFQTAIDSVTDCAIVITDKNNKVVRWNEAYQVMMGFPREIIEKQKISHNFAFLKNKLKNPEDYRKGILEVFSSEQETVHSFEMKNGKTIQRKATPVYRDGIFAGRVTYFSEIADGKVNKKNKRIG